MKHSLSHGILVCATALSLGACGAQPATVPSTPAPPTYVERVQERLQEVAERDLHELRYNPGLCGCPPFELKLQERWHRLTFDVADDSHPVLVELRAAVERDEAGGELGRYVIQGRLDDRVATCGQGALFLTLDPIAYGLPEPEPEDVDAEETDEDSTPPAEEPTGP